MRPKTPARDLRRFCRTTVIALFLLFLPVAGSLLAADWPKDAARPPRPTSQPLDANRAGLRDATRLGDELRVEDYRIRDQRITDALCLSEEKAQLRKEARLKAEKYIPVEPTRRENLMEEQPIGQALEETKKKKAAETLLQF